MRFWLGTHETSWLERLDVELFVSHRRLAKRKRLPRARAPWALDSGGFSELSLFGAWRTTEDAYVDAVCRYAAEVGQLAWAAPMDWMCEPWIVAKTGGTVVGHQSETVANFLRLRDRLGSLVVPVLQGWEPDEYLRHADAYAAAGVDLEDERVVGIGSVCRRGGSGEAERTLVALRPLRLHGFGLKTTALARVGHLLTSADSLAWSYNARRHPALDGCTHKSCSNCPRWALRWRDRVTTAVGTPQQMALLSEVA